MSLTTVGSQPKYGLINKKKKTAGGQANLARRPQLAAFNEDLDDDDNDADEDNDGNGTHAGRGPNASIARVNAQLAKAAARQALSLDSSQLEDPSVYDYDGSYDSFKAQEQLQVHKLSQPVDSEAPKSRYVSNLMSTAKMREKEKERVFERKLLKERQDEDKEFGDKPKFMTAAYKKKLIEDEKWAYEDKMAEEVEKRTDVRGSGMEGFYKNLLTKNVALGGDVDKNAISAYTAGSQRQEHILLDKDRESTVSSSSSSSSSSSGGGGGGGGSIGEEQGEGAAAATATATTTIATAADAIPTAGDGSSTKNTKEAVAAAEKSTHNNNNNNNNSTAGAGDTTAGDAAINNKNEQILSARDRYLARKRASADAATTGGATTTAGSAAGSAGRTNGSTGQPTGTTTTSTSALSSGEDAEPPHKKQHH